MNSKYQLALVGFCILLSAIGSAQAADPAAQTARDQAAEIALTALDDTGLENVKGGYIIGTSYKPDLWSYNNYGAYVQAGNSNNPFGLFYRLQAAKIRQQWINYAYHAYNSAGRPVVSCSKPYCK